MKRLKIVGAGKDEHKVLQERTFREWEKSELRDFSLLPKDWESMKKLKKIEVFERLSKVVLVSQDDNTHKKKLIALHHIHNLCLLEGPRRIFVHDLKIIRTIRTICKWILEQQVKGFTQEIKPFSIVFINFILLFFTPNSVEEQTYLIFRKRKSITEFLSHFLFPSKRNRFSLLETISVWNCMFFSFLGSDYYELHQIFLKYYNPIKQRKKDVARRIYKYLLKLVNLSHQKKAVVDNLLTLNYYIYVSNVSFIYRNFSYWFDTIPSLHEMYKKTLPVEQLLKIQVSALELTPLKCVNQRRWILESISGPCYAFGEICVLKGDIDLLVLKGIQNEVFGSNTTIKFDEKNPQNGLLCEYLKIYAFLLTGLEESVIIKVFNRTKKLITHYLYPLLYSIPFDRMIKGEDRVFGTFQNYNFILLNFIERVLIGFFHSSRVCSSINSIGKTTKNKKSLSLLERIFKRNVFLSTKICECANRTNVPKKKKNYFQVTVKGHNITSFYRHSFAACLMMKPFMVKSKVKQMIREYRTMNILWDNFYDFEYNAQGNMLNFFGLYEGECFLEEVAFGPSDITTLNRWMKERELDGDQLNYSAALRLLGFMFGLTEKMKKASNNMRKNSKNNNDNDNDNVDDDDGIRLVKDKGSGNTCEYCSKKVKKKLRCGRCKTSFYCNRECQAKHWKVHKKDCEKL